MDRYWREREREREEHAILAASQQGKKKEKGLGEAIKKRLLKGQSWKEKKRKVVRNRNLPKKNKNRPTVERPAKLSYRVTVGHSL